MIRFTLTEPQADQILNALGQMPFLQVNGLINMLLKQVQAQQQEQMTAQVQAQAQAQAPAVLPNGAYSEAERAVAIEG